MVDLPRIKQKLLALKAEVLDTMELTNDATKPVELDQNRVGRLSRIDAMQGQAMAKASAQRQQLLLKAIEGALLRVEHDSYGRCVECNEFIAEGRLEIDLTAEHCIACAAASE